MDSPLARVILATLGGALIVLFFISAYDWLLEKSPQPPADPVNSERIQHPFHHPRAVSALKRFGRLPDPEKKALKENLASNLISMEQWLVHLEKSKCQILCMGELHEESTRRFLAEAFFAKFSVNGLLLEATPKTLKRIIKRLAAGRDYFPLLDADILNVIRAAKNRNPDVKIRGIEETEEQTSAFQGHPNARDAAIADNFWIAFEPGLRHIILFGALHCTTDSNWLFDTLLTQASPTLKEAMLNVRILGEHQNGPVEAFVFFVDEIALIRSDFVIPDTRLLDPRIYTWFPVLARQTLKKYRTLIVFRPPIRMRRRHSSYDQIADFPPPAFYRHG